MTMPLESFCNHDREQGRYNLSHPWVMGGWRYATDGRVCVREPALGKSDTPQDKDDRRPNFFMMFKMYGYDATRCTEPLPEWQGVPEYKECSRCNGSGCDIQECKTCGGDGMCYCLDCGTEHDCGKCDGTGWQPIRGTTCPICKGERKVAERSAAEVAGRKLCGNYWHLIYQLGEVKYDPTNPARDKPLLLVAAGGREIVWMSIC